MKDNTIYCHDCKSPIQGHVRPYKLKTKEIILCNNCCDKRLLAEHGHL